MKQPVSPSSLSLWALISIGLVGTLLSSATLNETISSGNNQSASPTETSGGRIGLTLSISEKCSQLSSCARKGHNSNGSSCFCDQKCQLYDDCCGDSQWAEPIGKRIELGQEKLRERRSQLHCKRVNKELGDILMRAKCRPDWVKQQEDRNLAKLIVRRCEHGAERGNSAKPELWTDEEQDAELDPIGMMMPISDLNNGETYANSYCLRCNTLIGDGEWLEILKRRRLTYWSPLLECNYNVSSDNGTTLQDLVSNKKGQVLQYSRKLNKWTISAGSRRIKSDTKDDQRVCSITPMQPPEAESLLRACKADLIRSCPYSGHSTTLDEERLQQARLECKFGHQSITYSSNSESVYHNPACALCNHEQDYSCEPRSSQSADKSQPSRVNPEDEPMHNTGSFSVLMDLYGSASDEVNKDTMESGRQHQHLCPDHKVFDVFYMTCRCMICGLNRKYAEGRCVDKFKQAMVFTTDVCLIISVTSLALYLVLYALSTFDLRYFALRLAQWESELEERRSKEGLPGEERRKSMHGGSSHLYQRRGSNECSSASGSSSGARQSKNLATRGVACLAGSLLAAYLLFMLGHQTNARIKLEYQYLRVTLAAATYFCFMMAFCWMFLLAYDIWRTIRLATYKLKVPSTHSQSSRFLSYVLLALLASTLLVGFTLMIDYQPSADATSCMRQQLGLEEQRVYSYSDTSCADNWWQHFVHRYQPRFAHRPSSCWFSNRRALALFFGLPVTLIMLSNLLFFLHSSYMIFSTSSKSNALSGAGCTYQSTRWAPNNTCLVAPTKFAQSLHDADVREINNNNYDMMINSNPPNSFTAGSALSVQTAQSHLSEASLSASPKSQELMSTKLLLDLSSLLPRDDVKATIPSLPNSQPLQDNSNEFKQISLDESLISSTPSSLTGKYDSQLQSLQTMMSNIVKDYRIYCRLSTIVGLTWLMGLLASLIDTNDCLWYIFVFLNTLQGLFIFIAFGCKRSKMCNPELLFNYLKFWLINRCFRFTRN